MRIKKLLALALAGTMVFSMAACGSKDSDKDSNKKTEANDSAEESKDVSVDSVVEDFSLFMENMNENFSSKTYMKLNMSASGMAMTMEATADTTAFDGVSYTKSTTTVLGEKSEDEEYTIKNEDGSVTTAYKSADDDEWEVDTVDAADIEEVQKLDVETLKKNATMETKGDDYIVTMEIDASEMDFGDTDMLGDVSGMKVKVIVTYNAKDKAVTEMEVKFDLEALSEAFAEMGDITIDEFVMKVTDIKKNDKAIEIPAEIELD